MKHLFYIPGGDTRANMYGSVFESMYKYVNSEVFLNFSIGARCSDKAVLQALMCLSL